MNKNDVVGIVSRRIGLSQRDTRHIITAILDGITESLVKGGRLEIRGLGTFEVKRRRSRTGRNISTGEKVPIPPRKVVVFTPGKVLKRLVNE